MQRDCMREAGRFNAKLMDFLRPQILPGITTDQIDQWVHEFTLAAGHTPATLGYLGYPKSCCTSINDVICHGIPDERPLQEGDIMNIDASCIVDGVFGDCSRMVAIGEISEEKRRVMDVSKECLARAIKVCKPGAYLWQIGEAIEDYASSKKCSVVNQFVGHGIGLAFHEPPEIPHHYNELEIQMAPGMTFTIEPMINAGVREAIIDEDDGWTARTKDGRASAQWEHTLLITESGCEILTLRNE